MRCCAPLSAGTGTVLWMPSPICRRGGSVSPRADTRLSIGERSNACSSRACTWGHVFEHKRPSLSRERSRPLEILAVMVCTGRRGPGYRYSWRGSLRGAAKPDSTRPWYSTKTGSWVLDHEPPFRPLAPQDHKGSARPAKGRPQRTSRRKGMPCDTSGAARSRLNSRRITLPLAV